MRRDEERPVPVSGCRLCRRPPAGTPPYRIFNIGNHQPVPLLDYIAALEKAVEIEPNNAVARGQLEQLKSYRRKR